ncbi:MAG TPA: rhodanese-like domain-containing protein [Candidatus Acidoferrales bacterium]|nr:rhodanese-like domain-containing protein [Candidatus Acidoferrales bacterium]
MTDELFANLEITPSEVKQQLDRGGSLLFVDVREPWEHQLCHIEGSKLIPLGQIAASLPEFERADGVVVFCHTGRRSMDAAVWLRSQGVTGTRSMAGGIDRWSQEIDPRVPRY